MERNQRQQRERLASQALGPGCGCSCNPRSRKLCTPTLKLKKAEACTAPTRRHKLDQLDASNYLVWRPFYFGNLIVDPKDENKIFKPDLILLYSTTAAKTFNVVSGGAHGDFHDVWINPKESECRDRGRRRRPVAQRRRGNRWSTR